MKRKYTRRKQPGAAQEARSDADGDNADTAAADGGEQQESPAEGAMPLSAAGESAEKATFFPSGKRRGRPPGSRNLRPRGRGRGRGGRWGSGARRSRAQDPPTADEAELQLPAMSPTASYYMDQVCTENHCYFWDYRNALDSKALDDLYGPPSF